MRVLIIGCGYVGLPLGAELVRQGHEVCGLRRSRSVGADLKAAGIQPLIGDITQPAQLAGLPGPFDWVVNCVSTSGGNAEDYRAVYLQGTHHLLAWLSASPPAKFVYTSSTSVYGQSDGSIVDETSAAEPATQTGQVLLETEQVLLAAMRQTHFPAVILRLAGIYGPNRGYWFKQFLQGQARLEGEANRFLNMVHREDVVAAVIAALQRGPAGEIYNVVDDEPVTQLALFQWLSKTTGRPLPPPAAGVAASKRGLTSKRVSNHKLKAQLAYRFKYPTFREGFVAQ